MRSFDDIVAKTPFKHRAFCFAIGVLMALGQVPFSLPFLVLVGLPILAWLGVYAQTAKRAFGVGWWAGLGYFIVSLNWLVEPFLVDIARHGWMAPFALVGMAGGLSLFWGAAFYAVARTPIAPQTRFLLLACTWTLAEGLRTVVFSGFPWAHISYVWVNTPVIQWVSLIGPQGLGFTIFLLCFFPLMAPSLIWRRAAISMTILCVMIGYGLLRPVSVSNLKTTDTVLRLVQPNAEQHLKWRDDMIPVFYNRALTLAARPATQPIDVVIFPETTMPFLLGEAPEAMQRLANAAGPQTQVITGIRRRTNEGDFFNSLVHLDERGGVLSVYDKHHLVPFGEYIPLSWIAPRLGLSGLADAVGGYSRGAGPRVLTDLQIPSYLPLICYEAIFSRHAQAGAVRPEWIVHITNDAWFGQFSGPYQHLAQTQIRAIEQGLPVARAANTGVSALIDPYGRVLTSLPMGKSGVLDVTLPKPLGKTVYAYVGNWPLALIILLTCIFTAFPIGRALPRDR